MAGVERLHRSRFSMYCPLGSDLHLIHGDFVGDESLLYGAENLLMIDQSVVL